MTTSQLLTIVRQKIGQAIAEINGENPQFLECDLLEFVNTAEIFLRSLGVQTGIVSISPPNETITPEPTDVIGLLLAYLAASNMISDDLIKRLRDGELGLSFTSGATQITTNQAAISLTSSSSSLKRDFDLLLSAYLSGDPNVTVERLQ